MAVIYLRHPIHGAKVATMEMEAVYDQRNGWERYTPGAEDVCQPAETANFASPTNALAPRRRKIRVAELQLSSNDTE